MITERLPSPAKYSTHSTSCRCATGNENHYRQKKHGFTPCPPRLGLRCVIREAKEKKAKYEGLR